VQGIAYCWGLGVEGQAHSLRTEVVLSRLHQEGVDATVISPPVFGWSPGSPVGARFARCPTLHGLLPRRQQSANLTCKEIAFAPPRGPLLSSLGRLENRLIRPEPMVPWVLPAVWAGWREARRTRARFIWAVYPNLTGALAAAIHSRMSGLPLILDLTDPWESTVFREGLRARYLPHFEQFIQRTAHTILVTTQRLRQHLEEIGCQPPGGIIMAAGGFDLPDLAKATRPAPGPFTIRHVGLLSAHRNPRAFLCGLERLIERRPDLVNHLRVEFIGPIGADVDDIDAYTRHTLPQEVIAFRGRVPRQEACDLIAGADLLLLIQHDTELGDWTIPGKVFDYFETGRPVMAIARSGELCSLLHATGHYAFPHADTEGIAAALEQTIDRRTEGWQPTEAQRAALREYSWEALIPRIAGAIGQAVGEGASGEPPARG